MFACTFLIIRSNHIESCDTCTTDPCWEFGWRTVSMFFLTYCSPCLRYFEKGSHPGRLWNHILSKVSTCFHIKNVVGVRFVSGRMEFEYMEMFVTSWSFYMQCLPLWMDICVPLGLQLTLWETETGRTMNLRCHIFTSCHCKNCYLMFIK